MNKTASRVMHLANKMAWPQFVIINLDLMYGRFAIKCKTKNTYPQGIM